MEDQPRGRTPLNVAGAIAYGLVAALCVVGIFTDSPFWLKLVLSLLATFYAYRGLSYALSAVRDN